MCACVQQPSLLERTLPLGIPNLSTFHNPPHTCLAYGDLFISRSAAAPRSSASGSKYLSLSLAAHSLEPAPTHEATAADAAIPAAIRWDMADRNRVATMVAVEKSDDAKCVPMLDWVC